MLWNLSAFKRKAVSDAGFDRYTLSIVPGVDDGARDLYDAAKILQLEYRNHVQAVIVTPHYRAGMFETPQKEIERQFRKIDEITPAVSFRDAGLSGM